MTTYVLNVMSVFWPARLLTAIVPKDRSLSAGTERKGLAMESTLVK